MKKVLFIYPNDKTELRIPLAISILIAVIRKAGHEVRLFDTTFLGKFSSDNEVMSKLGTHLPTNLNDLVGETKDVDPKDELRSVIEQFKPDFIFVSLVERNFNTASGLLEGLFAEGVLPPLLVGGILPTVAPEFVLKQPWVSFICVGEGELAIPEFLENPGVSIPNIWTRNDYTYLRDLIDMDYVPRQDWSDFDQRHLLRPFMGKVYKGGAFEFSRGCKKSCTFCVAPRLRNRMSGCGKYHRTKTPIVAINEIVEKRDKFGLQMVSFGDTDFLSGVPTPVMWEFLHLYGSRVNLPYTIQTGIETLTNEGTLDFLRQSKCCAISVGVESGSERIRKTVIKKALSVDMMQRAFKLCRAYGLRVTANFMVGLPFETEEDVQETIKLNRLLNPPSIAVTYFTPFMGTELYDVCIKEKFYRPFKENVYDYPPIDMPQLSQNRIRGLVQEFVEDFKGYQNDFSIL